MAGALAGASGSFGGLTSAPSLPVSSAPVTPRRFDATSLPSPHSTSVEFVAPAPLPRDRAVLIRVDEAHAGHVTVADGPELRIGRHPTSALVIDDEGISTSALVIDDEGISRAHARLYQDGGQYFVEDLGSSNGTYVNGTRGERLPVTDGALIQLGPACGSASPSSMSTRNGSSASSTTRA